MYTGKLVSGSSIFRKLEIREGFEMKDCRVELSPFCFFLVVAGDEPQLFFEAECREDFLRIASLVREGSLVFLIGNGFTWDREDRFFFDLMSKLSGCPVVLRECNWKPDLQELWDSVK